MSDHDEFSRPSFSLARRWGAGLNLIIAVAALAALVAMMNYLAIRHYARWHVTRDAEIELSKRTRQVLASLTNQIKIIVYFDSNEDLFPRVKALLKEYQFASPQLQVEYVDYIRDAAAARLVKEHYRLGGINEKNLIIFDNNGRLKIVRDGDLSQYDMSNMSNLLSGKSQEVRRTHFKGELLFTSAIYSVSRLRPPIAYFLIGHEEPNPAGTDADGYSQFAGMLHDENNFDLGTLTLDGTNDVPANCSLLIIGGPQRTIPDDALDKIQRYLDQGGRLLVMFNSLIMEKGRRTGLEKLLAKWGVDASENIVLDKENSVSGNGGDVKPVNLGSHPIVHPMRDARVQLFFPRAIRALKSGGRSDDTKVDELLFTGPNSVVITDLRRGEVDRTQTGPKPLMVAVERSIPALQRGSTRLVAIGDSSFVENSRIIAGANRDLVSYAANWLVQQGLLLSEIPPRPIQSYKLLMTQSQFRSVRLILLLGMPGFVLLIGTIIWARRRN